MQPTTQWLYLFVSTLYVQIHFTATKKVFFFLCVHFEIHSIESGLVITRNFILISILPS